MGAADTISDLRSLLSIVAEETGALKVEDADEDSIGWTTEGPLPMTFGHVRRAHAALAALEATLSAAEPVAWLVRVYANDGSFIDERVYREKPDIRSTARTDFIPLYAAPPAPSVALKALKPFAADADIYDGQNIDDGEKSFNDNITVGDLRRARTAYAALSAQVQDESDIVDCLSAGKPFVFDPATNFCHADDGGAPEHGIKYIPAAQVQDVAGWQPKEIATWEDQQAFEAWAQGERYEMHQNPLHYLFMAPKTNAARQGWKAALQFIRDRSAAAPAKQEASHVTSQ
ncbi:hypothetical protein J2854_001737 [Agrobacterium tumefaciens]|nr:hypothetical protein [Agrobacterium tumefaciens]